MDMIEVVEVVIDSVRRVPEPDPKYLNTLKNLDIQGYQDCPPQLFVVFCAHN